MLKKTTLRYMSFIFAVVFFLTLAIGTVFANETDVPVPMEEPSVTEETIVTDQPATVPEINQTEIPIEMEKPVTQEQTEEAQESIETEAPAVSEFPVNQEQAEETQDSAETEAPLCLKNLQLQKRPRNYKRLLILKCLL